MNKKVQSQLIKNYLELQGYKITRSTLPDIWIARNCRQGKFGEYFTYETRYRYLKGKWIVMSGSEELKLLIKNALTQEKFSN